HATNLAFVHLVLDPQGSSDAHRHGGDELLFVLHGGPVEVRLQDGGEKFRLERGDYLHFYAEQSHSAHNISTTDKAEVLVIRFYHHREKAKRTDPPSREELQEVLREWITSGPAKQDTKRQEPKLELSAFAGAWMLELSGQVPRCAMPTSGTRM